MQGYCSKCFMMVDINELQTVRLINRQYVNKGICSTTNCGNQIIKTLIDEEVLVVPPGNHLPKDIYVGEDTPEWVLNHGYGQQLIKGEEITQMPVDIEGIKTLQQIKEESNVKKNPSTNP